MSRQTDLEEKKAAHVADASQPALTHAEQVELTALQAEAK